MRALITNIVDEGSGIKTFIVDKFFKFEPGQWMSVTISDFKHDFTISSSPTQKLIQFTTKFRPTSDYKKLLWNLKIGDAITLDGPHGQFLLGDHSPKLFLYKGMGITPFRSMQKFIADKNLPIDVVLSEGKLPKDYKKREWLICGAPTFVDKYMTLAKKLGVRFRTEDFPGY